MKRSLIAISLAALLGVACTPYQRKGDPAPILSLTEQAMLEEDMDQTYAIDDLASFEGSDYGGADLGYTGETLTDRDQQALEIMSSRLPKKMYFETSLFALNKEGIQQAKINADFLSKYPNVHVLINGNADPRGSQDFNFYLGQKRANAVKEALMSMGINEARICTVSYGELRPAASPADFSGDWKKAYRLDRRAEIEYGKTCGGDKHA